MTRSIRIEKASEVKQTRRYVIPSDDHEFQGRVFDLVLPLEVGFQSYEQAKEYPDALYAINVGERVHNLARRVESLNIVGTMLWTRRLPRSFKRFPISRYEWLNAIADIFLMRLISVTDCAALLINDVFQCGIKPRLCTIDALQKASVPVAVLEALKNLNGGHIELRSERNYRFHHGFERAFSDDDTTFRIAALYEHRFSEIDGTDQHGRPVDPKRYFRDGIQELKGEFVPATRNLYRNLRRLYDLLDEAFDAQFSLMFRARTKSLPWE